MFLSHFSHCVNIRTALLSSVRSLGQRVDGRGGEKNPFLSSCLQSRENPLSGKTFVRIFTVERDLKLTCYSFKSIKSLSRSLLLQLLRFLTSASKTRYANPQKIETTFCISIPKQQDSPVSSVATTVLLLSCFLGLDLRKTEESFDTSPSPGLEADSKFTRREEPASLRFPVV